MSTDPPRLVREKRTIRAMVGIYCHDHHGTAGELCPECLDFLDYAYHRLNRCPFGVRKPTCGNCRIHCYKPAMRSRAKEIMRYAGPRLLRKHPLLALWHLVDARRRPPELPKREPRKPEA